MKYKIGDLVADEDGNSGIVCIKWDDGDLCTIENDAAHPKPRWTPNQPLLIESSPQQQERR